MSSRVTREINPSRVISGVPLARTLPPVLPPNFLTRKSILSSVAIDRAGVTLIAAPAGYGKTSLVTEYVSTLDFPVIWLSFDDSDSETTFNANLIQAVRNVLPNYADWFSSDAQISTPEVLRKILAEVANHPGHLILVLDNNRVKNGDAAPLADFFLDLVPNNIHTIAMRRNIPSGALSRLQSIPNFKFFGKDDLEFSEQEIISAASLQGVNPENPGVFENLKAAHGWPAAVQLILKNLSRGAKLNYDTNTFLEGSEQIKYLVHELLETMSADDIEALVALSVFNEFSTETAEIVLQEKYSFSKINNFASEAIFIRHTPDPVYSYIFSPVVKAGLRKSSVIKEEEFKEIHLRLSAYFESKGQALKALEHAKLAGDQKRYRHLFRESMRQLIAIGRGKDLLRMAELVGDNTSNGRIKRQTVELIGYTADFQYSNAQSLISEMLSASKGTEMENFITKFTAAASAYVDFATGLDAQLDKNVAIAIGASTKELDLAPIDKISILKVAVAKEVIYDSSDRIYQLQETAIALAGEDSSPMVQYSLGAINACVLLYKGEFTSAYSAANNAIAQAEREGYAGIFGPLDVMYVKARCLLEFSQIDAALIIFEQIRNLATTWKQHVWVFVAESFIARDLAVKGNPSGALELVRAGRDRVREITFNNSLATYCDLTELFIRNSLSDWARVGILLERLPNFLLVERIRSIYEVATGKPPTAYDVKKMPNGTPKEQIYKCLAETEENLDREAKALVSMRRALEIGAQVGAKETFLRQEARILNLIIHIAGEKPTVYLEDLASLITTRLKSRHENLLISSAALTKRELEILRHLETGKPISAIALTLHVSQNTMKTHLKNIYRKIGAGGREEAVAKAKALYIL
jgi:ATP/maltotriose-dependent transcriptional regulator MalT